MPRVTSIRIGLSVEKIPVEDLMGDAVLIDVSDRGDNVVIAPSLLEAALRAWSRAPAR